MPVSSELIPSSFSSSNNSLSLAGSQGLLAQEVLVELGWKNLVPLMRAAEQSDQALVATLQVAYAHYNHLQNITTYKQLEKALDDMIEKIQTDYLHAKNLQMAAKQRLAKSSTAKATGSYFNRVVKWAFYSVQYFFESDDASLVTRYSNAAQSRQEVLVQLRQYRVSLKEHPILVAQKRASKMQRMMQGNKKLQVSPVSPMVAKEKSDKETSNNPGGERISLLGEIPLDNIKQDSKQLNSKSSDAKKMQLLETENTEFRISSSGYDQSYPSAATLMDGGFVVVWAEDGLDGSEYGIFAQQYNVSGSKTKEVFQVNTQRGGTQWHPSIAALPDGGFVITWSSGSGQDGSEYGIFAQKYNVSGDKVGAEFQVNSYTISYQENPSITALKEDEFVIAWCSSEQDGSISGIYAQKYNASGDKSGAELQVSSYIYQSQISPLITGLEDGGFVVAWKRGGSSSGFYAQRYNALGSKVGAEFLISYSQNDDQLSITSLQDGGFVVTWPRGKNSYQSYIYIQRYDVLGNKVGAELQVNSYQNPYQKNPSITALKEGGFVVAWTNKEQDGSGYGIYAQSYNVSGSKAGGDFQVNSYTNYGQDPSIIALQDGGFIVVWADTEQARSAYGIYAQRFDSNGRKVKIDGSLPAPAKPSSHSDSSSVKSALIYTGAALGTTTAFCLVALGFTRCQRQVVEERIKRVSGTRVKRDQRVKRVSSKRVERSQRVEVIGRREERSEIEIEEVKGKQEKPQPESSVRYLLRKPACTDSDENPPANRVSLLNQSRNLGCHTFKLQLYKDGIEIAHTAFSNLRNDGTPGSNSYWDKIKSEISLLEYDNFEAAEIYYNSTSKYLVEEQQLINEAIKNKEEAERRVIAEGEAEIEKRRKSWDRRIEKARDDLQSKMGIGYFSSDYAYQEAEDRIKKMEEDRDWELGGNDSGCRLM